MKDPKLVKAMLLALSSVSVKEFKATPKVKKKLYQKGRDGKRSIKSN